MFIQVQLCTKYKSVFHCLMQLGISRVSPSILKDWPPNVSSWLSLKQLLALDGMIWLSLLVRRMHLICELQSSSFTSCVCHYIFNSVKVSWIKITARFKPFNKLIIIPEKKSILQVLFFWFVMWSILPRIQFHRSADCFLGVGINCWIAHPQFSSPSANKEIVISSIKNPTHHCFLLLQTNCALRRETQKHLNRASFMYAIRSVTAQKRKLFKTGLI